MLLKESVVAKPIFEEKDSSKLPETVLCRVTYPICNVGELNANKRVYEKEVWDKVLENTTLQEMMGQRRLFGQAEHPLETQSDLQLTSHVIHKTWIDEGTNKVYQTFDIVDTPTGRIVDSLLRADCQVGVSTRAEGDLEEAEDDEGNKYSRVLPESYRYITTDFTADPSTFGALPVEQKRNVVASIKNEMINEKANKDEKAFAQQLLEKMETVKEDKKLEEGTWALPKTKEDAEKVVELMKSPLTAKEAKEKFYGLVGDDMLFDQLDNLKEDIDARWFIKDFIKKSIDEWKEKIDPKSAEILQSILVEEMKVKKALEKGLLKPETKVTYMDKPYKVVDEGVAEITIAPDVTDKEVRIEQDSVMIDGNPFVKVHSDGTITIMPVAQQEPELPEVPVTVEEPKEELEVPTPVEKEVPEKKVKETTEDGLDQLVAKLDELKTKRDSGDSSPELAEEIKDLEDTIAAMGGDVPFDESVIPVEGELDKKVVSGNLLRSGEDFWSVKEVSSVGLSINQIGQPGTDQFIEWDKVPDHNFVKVGEKLSESKIKDFPSWLDKLTNSIEKSLVDDGVVRLEDIEDSVLEIRSDIVDTIVARLKSKGLKIEESKIKESNPSVLVKEEDEGWNVKITGDGPDRLLTHYTKEEKDEAIAKGQQFAGVWDIPFEVIEEVVQNEGMTTEEFDKKRLEILNSDLPPEEQLSKLNALFDERLGKVKEDFEGFQGEAIEVGDTVQINDKEGNTTIVPSAVVYDISTVEPEGEVAIEITGSENEDERQWYDEGNNEIVLLKKANESKLSTSIEEMTNLKIQEASTRAERDTALESVDELTGLVDKLKNEKSDIKLQMKMLLGKVKNESSKSNTNKTDLLAETKRLYAEVNALRAKLEEKAKLSSEANFALEALKESLGKDLQDLKESAANSEQKTKNLKEEYENKIKEVEKEKVSEGIIQGKKEVITEYIEFRLAELGLTIGENTRALLDECKSLGEVDNILENVRDIRRRSALHSGTIEEIHVETQPVDLEQDRIASDVESAFKGINGD